MDSPQRVVLDIDSTEIPVYGNQGRAPTTDISSPPAITRCCCSIGKTTAWRQTPARQRAQRRRLGRAIVTRDRAAAEARERSGLRADAAFAKPEIYEALEQRGVNYAIRIPANENLERDIAELLPRPVGRPSSRHLVEYKSFLYQAASWKKARRVVAKVEDHQGELFPRVGFIVTNLSLPSRAMVRFYNKRGTAEQWIKEGKQAVKR